MTSEHLLDAIGLLDDGLIQEAERFSPQRRQVHAGRWLGLAASLLVVIGLGYGVLRLGLAGGMKGSGAGLYDNAAGGAASAPAGSADPGMGEWIAQEGGGEPEEPAAPDSAPDLAGGFIQLDQAQPGIYLLTGQRSSLPEDAVRLGVLSLSAPDAPFPSTNVAEYAGLELWRAAAETLPTTLYVVLPDGQCAVAELAEP